MTDQLLVIVDDDIVGELSEVTPGSGEMIFTYRPSWLSKSGSFPISTALPLRLEPYPPSDCVPYFANLLPEGEQATIIEKILGSSVGDIAGMLARMGGDLAGSIHIVPEASEFKTANNPSVRLINNDEELERVINELPAKPFLIDDHEVTLSLAGAHEKLPVVISEKKIGIPLGGHPSTHILKPRIARLYGSAHNEAFCLKLASEMGLNVPNIEVRKAGSVEFTLIERYDRTIETDGTITRIHQEDFCQALQLRPTEKYEARGGPSFKRCFRLIQNHSNNRLRDRLAFRDAAIFNVLIENTDAHGKNFSFLITPIGNRLAPFYDLLSAFPYEGITQNLAMKIGGNRRGGHITADHWDKFASDCDVGATQLRSQLQKMAERIPEAARSVHKRMTEAGNDHKVLDIIIGDIERRSRDVLDNLKKRRPPVKAETPAKISVPQGSAPISADPSLESEYFKILNELLAEEKKISEACEGSAGYQIHVPKIRRSEIAALLRKTDKTLSTLQLNDAKNQIPDFLDYVAAPVEQITVYHRFRTLTQSMQREWNNRKAGGTARQGPVGEHE